MILLWYIGYDDDNDDNDYGDDGCDDDNDDNDYGDDGYDDDNDDNDDGDNWWRQTMIMMINDDVDEVVANIQHHTWPHEHVSSSASTFATIKNSHCLQLFWSIFGVHFWEHFYNFSRAAAV